MNTDTIIKNNFEWVATVPNKEGIAESYYGVKVTENSIIATDVKLIFYANNNLGMKSGWYSPNGEYLSEDIPDSFPTNAIVEMNKCFYECNLNELQFKEKEHKKVKYYETDFYLYDGSFACIKEYFDKILAGFNTEKTKVFLGDYLKRDNAVLVKFRQMTKKNYRTAFVLFKKLENKI